jgi:hypothetical protein
MPLNREWHLRNPMPRPATTEDRVAWHLRHEDACGCRKMPDSIRKEAEAGRGRHPRPPAR